jgi:GTP-binding protein
VSVFHSAFFLTSVADLNHLPAVSGIEIAFAGRSNSGKSSVINTLANHRQLARVSKTPGRTQLLNFFQLGERNCFLVDLPGYGYARVSPEVQKHWQQLVAGYLEARQSLGGLVLIMDIRHPLTALDQQLLKWFAPTNKPVHTLLTKSDKLSRSQASATLLKVQKSLADTAKNYSAQLFSSLRRSGVEELGAVLAQWLTNGAQATMMGRHK